MINLSEKGKGALDEIRQKVEQRDPRWTGPELDKLEAVYSEITMQATGKETKPIDRTCSSCINRAVGIAYNYVTFHEQVPVDRQEPGKVVDITTNGTQQVGTIGINNWTARKAKLESIGFVYSKEENLFKFADNPEHIVNGDTVGSLSEPEFQTEVDRILAAEKGTEDAGTAFDTHNPLPEQVTARIEQLIDLGFEFDHDSQAYNAADSKSSMTMAALQTISNEDWNMFIDAEEGFQHSHQAKASGALPTYTAEHPAAADGVKSLNLVPDSVNGPFVPMDDAPGEDNVELKYDPATDQVIIVEADKSHTPFTEDLDVLLFPILFDLAKQKGWKGARPPKAKLVEFLTKPTK